MAPPILKMEMKMGGLWVKKERSQVKRFEHKKTKHQKISHHAMGKVINNDINCIKLKPIDFAPSDSSK
jgi:hypothetical protein